MTFFTWKDDYSVGVTAIDNDHKMLIDLIDQLHEAFVSGDMASVCEAVLDSLVDYTERHFAAEEVLMTQCSYPDIACHHEQHENLAAQVVEIRDRFARGEQQIGNELLAFLHDWLYFHIIEADMKYRPTFEAAGMIDSAPAAH